METRLADFIRETRAGQVAEDILRRCVHCGFCTATCPTYQLLGDELDGPRGRIYLIKQMLEGETVSERTRTHLDRCLSCRSCETTCPSGVKYSHLLDIGREVLESRLQRPWREALPRALLKAVLPRPALFGAAVALGRALRPILPGSLADKLPVAYPAGQWPTSQQPRRMLVLAGCVQPSLAPNINRATARVFERLGISLCEAPSAGCCGAVRYHLGDVEAAKADMRRNIDAWWPQLERGVEAVVVTASGCGVQVRDYGHILADDPVYADKAARVSALCRDPSEILAAETDKLLSFLEHNKLERGRLAFHAPCTLQHGLRIKGVIETLLQAAGYTLTPVPEGHLCCGSAGTYALLQPDLSTRLRERKIEALSGGSPTCIATANIGCLTHLQAGCAVPVRHWIELMDEVLG